MTPRLPRRRRRDDVTDAPATTAGDPAGSTTVRRRPRRRTVALAGVVALALVGGGTAWAVGRSDGTSASTQEVTVEKGTFSETVSGSGTIAAAKQSDLDFEVSGRVTDVVVSAGDTVEKGQELATLDTTSLEAQLASAQAQLTSAQSTAADDGSESSARQAANTATVTTAEAAVDQAEDDLDAATLTAPFTGTVADVTIAEGDSVGSGSSSGTGGSSADGTGSTGGTTSSTSSTSSSAAITLVTPKDFVVDATVSADDVTRVEEGMQVEITPTGADEPVYGTVSEVGLVAQTSTSGTAEFPVTIAVTGEQDDLYSGTSADIAITVEQVTDVLSVPTMALTTTDDTTTVQKVVDGEAVTTTVTVGQTYGTSTEITDGLEEGDTVQITLAARMPGGGQDGGQDGEQGGFPSGGGGGTGGGFPGGGQMPGQP